LSQHADSKGLDPSRIKAGLDERKSEKKHDVVSAIQTWAMMKQKKLDKIP
jgi:hypothetical protein